MTIKTQTVPTLEESYSSMLFGSSDMIKSQIQEIEIDKLTFYKDQVYRMYTPDEIAAMVSSIKENGILHPVIVRPVGDDTYEVLSGRNRTKCAKQAGLFTVPCMIKKCDDLQAKLMINDTNLCQRKSLSIRELAFGYKEQLDVMKQLHQSKKTISAIAERTGENVKTIQRYIRLTFLIPELFNLIEQKKHPIMTGVALSYFTTRNQQIIFQYLNDHPSTKIKDGHLQQAHKFENLTDEILSSIFDQPKSSPKCEYIKITYAELERLGYYLLDKSNEQIKQQVMQTLSRT